MKIIIFGNRDMAELAHYYFNNDTDLKVSAFCVDGKYIKENNFCNLPVVPFEEIDKAYPSSEYLFHAPIYASEMNKTREAIYNKIKNKNYTFCNYISSKAYTWNSKIGNNCFILEGVNLQPFSEIGNNCIIWSFSHIGHHSKIGNNVFISSHVVIAGHNIIKDNCFMGTNCTTKNSITIESLNFIGQDASVVKNIENSEGVFMGIPAKRIKTINEIKC
jgi:sugar O-acyltransferase (sialic acid O-acetyltransferase NeuD family)